MELTGHGDGDHRKWRQRRRRCRQRHRRARVPSGQWVACGNRAVGDVWKSRENGKGPTPSKKIPKTSKTTKTTKNHQNLVEIKGNGKGYLRGTVVDVMETAGKWYGVGAPEALP